MSSAATVSALQPPFAPGLTPGGNPTSAVTLDKRRPLSPGDPGAMDGPNRVAEGDSFIPDE